MTLVDLPAVRQAPSVVRICEANGDSPKYTVADPVLPTVSYDGWCSL